MLVGLSICKFSWKILNWIHPRQNLPPPLWELLEALCLISPRCSTEHLNCSFVLTAIKLFNASLSVYWGRTPAVFTWTMLDCYLDQTSARTVVVFRKRRIWHYVLLCDPRTTGVKTALVYARVFSVRPSCVWNCILMLHVCWDIWSWHWLTVSGTNSQCHGNMSLCTCLFIHYECECVGGRPPDEASLERKSGSSCDLSGVLYDLDSYKTYMWNQCFHVC